jgi:hypothetical protein
VTSAGIAFPSAVGRFAPVEGMERVAGDMGRSPGRRIRLGCGHAGG